MEIALNSVAAACLTRGHSLLNWECQKQGVKNPSNGLLTHFLGFFAWLFFVQVLSLSVTHKHISPPAVHKPSSMKSASLITPNGLKEREGEGEREKARQRN